MVAIVKGTAHRNKYKKVNTCFNFVLGCLKEEKKRDRFLACIETCTQYI